MNTILKLGIAALCFGGAAFAQPAPTDPAGPGRDKPDMAKMAAQMCQDRKAHAVGEIAYLEAKLALTDAQKPLFERWKKVKLANANGESCAPPPFAEGKPSLIQHMKLEEKMLQERLGALKAELPVLEPLYASLSEEQKKAFAPRPMGPHPMGGPMGRPPMDGHMGMMGHMGQGPDGPDHPPAPEK